MPGFSFGRSTVAFSRQSVTAINIHGLTTNLFNSADLGDIDIDASRDKFTDLVTASLHKAYPQACVYLRDGNGIATYVSIEAKDISLDVDMEYQIDIDSRIQHLWSKGAWIVDSTPRYSTYPNATPNYFHPIASRLAR